MSFPAGTEGPGVAASANIGSAGSGFRHEALLYAGEEEFVERAGAFVRDAVAADEPTLVMVGRAKIDLLRSALDGDAERVRFVDMEVVGRNPARIIPAWRAFADANSGSGRRLRGIGEPIWAGRGADELVECHRHEALLNLAFADARDFWLICPYDAQGLDSAVIAEARRTHPLLGNGNRAQPSAEYMGAAAAAAPFSDPLPEPRGKPQEIRFRAGDLKAIRERVIRVAAKAGLTSRRGHDLALAVNELATNSIRYGGGEGTLRLWEEGGNVLCEVRDRGRIDAPLVGRVAPRGDQVGGYGLWLANHLCDLVQVRSLADHSVVRVHMRRRPA